MNGYDSLGKYAKLTIISSLSRPRSLSELGIAWFSENGRFYKKKALNDIEIAHQKGYLISEQNKVFAVKEILIDEVYKDRPKAKKDFKIFLNQKFSIETYFDIDTVKSFVKNNSDIAACTQLKHIMNAPLLIHMLNKEKSEIFSMIVHLLGFEDYVQKINHKMQENATMFKNYDESLKWKDSIETAAKHHKLYMDKGVEFKPISNEKLLKTLQD